MHCFQLHKFHYLNHQKLELLEFARKKSLSIDEFVEITISSRKSSKQRRIDELLSMLNDGDILLVTELSRLGRSTTEVITIVNSLAKRNIRVIVLKQNLDISQQDINSKVTLIELIGLVINTVLFITNREG